MRLMGRSRTIARFTARKETATGEGAPPDREGETKVSRTDPEAGYMVREGKPKGFFYLDHRTVDGKLGIITDSIAGVRPH